LGEEPVTSSSTETEQVERLVESHDLAGALESERFKTFLDHVPIAIAVSELLDPEVIVYANPEFERVSGLTVSALERQYWDILEGERSRNRMAFPSSTLSSRAAIVWEGSSCQGPKTL
jgi:PAS domain-containing protein